MAANAPSAGLARARLLHDVAHTRFQEPQPASQAKTLADSLSPDEQTSYAIQIAKSFKQHYLSEVLYLKDSRMAAATLKPINPADIPHTIYVDSDGNVDVSYDFTSRAGQRYFPGWILLFASALVVLIALLTSALMTMT
jgi:hypothetical protein